MNDFDLSRIIWVCNDCYTVVDDNNLRPCPQCQHNVYWLTFPERRAERLAKRLADLLIEEHTLTRHNYLTMTLRVIRVLFIVLAIIVFGIGLRMVGG